LKADKVEEERDRIGTWGKLNPARLDIILKYAENKILDAGCSSGEYIRSLLAKGYDAYGFDICYSDQWEGEHINRFKIGNIYNIPYGDEEFDTVTAFEILEHVEDVDKAFSEIKRVVRKNVILSVPDCEIYPIFKESGLTFSHWIDRTHIQFFTEISLKRKLKEHGLSIRYFNRINPIYPDKIILKSIGLPFLLTNLITKTAAKWPLRKKYFMTLICVADK